MFSDEQLKDLISKKCIGVQFPYNTHDKQEIEAYIRRLFHRIKRIPNIKCDAEWNHFGSGYASYIEFFCYRQEDAIVKQEEYGRRTEWIDGIVMNISRLAPVAIMGEDNRSKTFNNKNNVVGGAGSPLSEPDQLGVSEKLQSIAEQLKQALTEFDYELLKAEDINKPLKFKAKIPTMYRDPKEYLIMDAIFYWLD